MNLLITGSKGYVGQALQRQLEQEQIPYFSADRSKFDLTNIESIRAYFKGKEITHVLHLAGAVETNEAGKLFDANIAGLYNLLIVCVEAKIHFFTLASTNVVYGIGKKTICRGSDQLEPDPMNCYAVSKYFGEVATADFCARHSIAYANVRIGDIYGPGQKLGKLVKAVVDGIVTGTTLSIYGQGVRTRDYIYIDDVAKGLLFICRNELTGPVNLGTGIGTSAAQMVEIGARLSGGICEVKHIDVEREDTSQIVLDVSALRDAGFSAETSIEEGLKKCVIARRNDERT